MTKTAFKLLRMRADGSLGSLFVNRSRRLPVGVWMPAEEFRPKKLAYRPGWHCLYSPHAPHLSEEGRVWCEVHIRNYKHLARPEYQGGPWLLAKQMKIVRIIQ